MKIFYTILLVFSFFIGNAQKVWQVPAENTKGLSPFAFTKETQEKGKQIYTKNCMSCHGNPTKGDFVKLTPEPGDISGKKFQIDLDGELLYKISTGRGAMPTFKAILTPEEIWNLISYLRTFHDRYVQKIADKLSKEGATSENIKLLLTYLESKKMLQVQAQTKDSTNKIIPGIEVKLFAQRRFGNLLLDEPKITNVDGKVEFILPSDLPGDSIGNVHLIAQVMPEGALNPITNEGDYAFGKPTNKPSLIAGRHLWSKLVNIPIWLLVTYLVVVLTILGFIGYTMLLLKKIYETGQKEIKENK